MKSDFQNLKSFHNDLTSQCQAIRGLDNNVKDTNCSSKICILKNIVSYLLAFFSPHLFFPLSLTLIYLVPPLPKPDHDNILYDS